MVAGHDDPTVGGRQPADSLFLAKGSATPMPVVLVGTLDTKGREIEFARDRLHARGLQTLVIDAGSSLAAGDPPSFIPEIGSDEVFRAAGTTIREIEQARDRGNAVSAAARGVVALVDGLHTKGRVHGILGLGGSAGTVIGTAAMRVLPFGVPKVMVSTLASGQTRPYVGGSDIMMLYSVADLAGLNRVTRTVLANAAHAMIQVMVRPREVRPRSRAISRSWPRRCSESRPRVSISRGRLSKWRAWR